MRAKMTLKTAAVAVAIVCISAFSITVVAEDPYRFFNWNVTYGDIYPLGVRQQVFDSLFYFHLIHSKHNNILCVLLSHTLTQTGNTYQRSIPRSRHSFCYQRQPHHQCLQQLGPAISPLLVLTLHFQLISKHQMKKK